MKYKIKEVYASKGGKITVETLYGNYKEAVADLTELFNNREKIYLTELALIGLDDNIVMFTKTIYRRE
jgi:hypothetical protein